jgi:hypothetical protein
VKVKKTHTIESVTLDTEEEIEALLNVLGIVGSVSTNFDTYQYWAVLHDALTRHGLPGAHFSYHQKGGQDIDFERNVDGRLIDIT